MTKKNDKKEDENEQKLNDKSKIFESFPEVEMIIEKVDKRTAILHSSVCCTLLICLMNFAIERRKNQDFEFPKNSYLKIRYSFSERLFYESRNLLVKLGFAYKKKGYTIPVTPEIYEEFVMDYPEVVDKFKEYKARHPEVVW